LDQYGNPIKTGSWLSLSFSTLFKNSMAKVLGTVFAVIGFISVVKFFFGKDEPLPVLDEGSAEFPDPFDPNGGIISADTSTYPDYGSTGDYPDYGSTGDYPDYGSTGGYPDYGSTGGNGYESTGGMGGS
jgi:hypothetical protein